MLTLDPTTLYYFNLSNGPVNACAMAEGWKDKLTQHGGKLSNRNRSRSQTRATTPSLTSGTGTSRPTRPPSSVRSVLSNTNVRIRENGDGDDFNSDIDGDGIISKRDESKGAERDAAINSPHKAKGRATNAVSNVVLCTSHSS